MPPLRWVHDRSVGAQALGALGCKKRILSWKGQGPNAALQEERLKLATKAAPRLPNCSLPQSRLDGEAGALWRQVEELEATVAASRARCAALEAAEQQDLQDGAGLLGSAGAAASGSGAGSQGQQAETAGPAQANAAAGLAEHLAAAYQAAGFAPDASVTPLQMLQKVEAALEECLATIGPPGSQGALAAEAVERAREKERRQVARAIKLAARQAEHVGCWSGVAVLNAAWAGMFRWSVLCSFLHAALRSKGIPMPHCHSILSSCHAVLLRRHAFSACWIVRLRPSFKRRWVCRKQADILAALLYIHTTGVALPPSQKQKALHQGTPCLQHHAPQASLPAYALHTGQASHDTQRAAAGGGSSRQQPAA